MTTISCVCCSVSVFRSYSTAKDAANPSEKLNSIERQSQFRPSVQSDEPPANNDVHVDLIVDSFRTSVLQGNILSTPMEKLSRPPIINVKQLNKLHRAVYEGQIKEVIAIVKQPKKDLDQLDDVHFISAMSIAAIFGRTEIVTLLAGKGEVHLKNPADINKPDKEGRTPLTLVR